MTKGFLIDMDGVIYSNDELIKGAGNFIAALQESNIPFLFLTNNSQRTPRDAVNKLAEMGGKGIRRKYLYFCYGNRLVLVPLKTAWYSLCSWRRWLNNKFT
jgi:NagD protein